jgi:hypothetical protein
MLIVSERGAIVSGVERERSLGGRCEIGASDPDFKDEGESELLASNEYRGN